MRLKIPLFLFLFLYSFSAKAQKNRYPEKLFDYGDYYYWNVENIRGNIKKVSTVNFEYTFNKKDSTYVEYSFHNAVKKVYVDINEVFEFDRSGNLLKSYYVDQDSEQFLNEENKFNDNHQLIFNKRRSKRSNRKKSTSIIHEKIEKRNYTSSGKLKEVWVKSSFQKDYFIKKRYTYNKHDLVEKYETFNAHIETDNYVSCKGSSVPQDYVIKYVYDDKNRLTGQHQYMYKYSYDRRREGIVKLRDFSSYKLKQSTLYVYSVKNRLVMEKRSFYHDYQKGNVNIITYTYDAKDRLTKRMTTYKAGHGSGYIYEYHEKKGKLDKVVSVHIEKKIGIHTILKRITDIKKKEEDGFVSIHYNRGRKAEICHYNKYGDETLSNDLDDHEKRSYQYSYDKHGNWTSRTLFENGIKTKRIERTLAYYSE
ncbi:hypothetical protein [Kordia sp.]|uniref:hypothetical protein n=1 Tax=Kordia sp. TaxID=1965332 RepID=UPI00386901D2